ncbi:MAG: TrmJ/YjtD family RNA methyltransferase [Treponema sp.]|jgi:tRNA/rRNA methyltransferase/tRNA (cytidine32/uridine32-2'-O)-methyltransferase|nr:TrmJ/YjtD family RNA methyltransferase [Treponema sp.]
MRLSDIIIILCRPSEPGNVGAVCRAMKNMGLSRLRLVLPGFRSDTPPLDEALLRARAVHAEDIWDNAPVFDSLAEAAADCSLLAGTTRRRGRKRKSVTMEPRTLAAWLKERSPSGGGMAAIVFGNERTGLEDAELNLCNIASHIPVSEDFPSLNLSHAVQIYAYELFLAFGADGTEGQAGSVNAVKGEWVPLTGKQADGFARSVTSMLAAVGFYKHPGREEQTRFLRDLVSRAGLTEREGKYLENIFAKAARLGSMQGQNAALHT